MFEITPSLGPPFEAWMKEYNDFVQTYENVLRFRKLKVEGESKSS